MSDPGFVVSVLVIALAGAVVMYRDLKSAGRHVTTTTVREVTVISAPAAVPARSVVAPRAIGAAPWAKTTEELP
jgi:hypothetical protein